MVNWRGITAIETSGRWDLNKIGEDAAKIGGLFTPISVHTTIPMPHPRHPALKSGVYIAPFLPEAFPLLCIIVYICTFPIRVYVCIYSHTAISICLIMIHV